MEKSKTLGAQIKKMNNDQLADLLTELLKNYTQEIVNELARQLNRAEGTAPKITYNEETTTRLKQNILETLDKPIEP